MLVANHHHRRRDLRHRELRQLALAGLQHVAIAAAPTATYLRPRRLQGRDVAGIYQSNGNLRRRGRVDHVAPEQIAHSYYSHNQNMYAR